MLPQHLLESPTSCLGVWVMSAFSAIERRAVLSLASIFSLRMMGLFMILPVFAIYGTQLEGASPFLIGVAIGAYGLAQLLLQIPFGVLADRFDRRLLILLGLVLFVLGGVLAAASTSIWGVIAGRFLQGMGAISAVVMALMSDLVRDENRSKGMAILGMSIGVAFALSFVVGPWLAASLGLSGLFIATAVLGGAAILLTLIWLPRGRQVNHLPADYQQQLRNMLALPELRRLNVGIFSLHLVMMACFVALPSMLVSAGLPATQHGWLYLPVMLLSFVVLVPAVVVAEKKQQIRRVYLSAITLLLISMPILALVQQSLWPLLLAVALFFFAFNLLEAMLPSLVSKMCPPASKGTAMGIYSTSQFAGAFVGGALGGLLLQKGGSAMLFWGLAVVMLCWLWRASSMASPRYWQSVVLQPEQDLNREQLEQLRQLPGVEELVMMNDDQLLYLKVDQVLWQPDALINLPVRIKTS